MVLCPLCNRLISPRFPLHACEPLLEADEYISEGLGVRLLWDPDHGWSAYSLEGDVLERLSFEDVVEWVVEGSFRPVC